MATTKPARERVDIAAIRRDSGTSAQHQAQERAKEQHAQRLRDIGWNKRK